MLPGPHRCRRSTRRTGRWCRWPVVMKISPPSHASSATKAGCAPTSGTGSSHRRRTPRHAPAGSDTTRRHRRASPRTGGRSGILDVSTLPRLEPVVSPDPRHGVLPDAGVLSPRARRPVRRVRRGGVQRVVHVRVDHLGGHLGPAAPAWCDHPDTANGGLGEAGPPPANRVRGRGTPAGDLVVRDTLGGQQQNLGPGTTTRCGNDDDRAIASSAARSSSLSSKPVANIVDMLAP